MSMRLVNARYSARAVRCRRHVIGRRWRITSSPAAAHEPVTNFSTVSRARLRHASAGPQPAQGPASRRELPKSECVKRCDDGHQGQDLSGAMAGVRSEPGASADAAPSRAEALRARRPDAGRLPRYRPAGSEPPLR